MKRTLNNYYELMKNEITKKEDFMIDFMKDILENNKDFLDTLLYPIYYVKDETYTIYNDLIRIFYNDKDFFEIRVNDIAKINKDYLYEFIKTKITRYVLNDNNPYAKDNDFVVSIENALDLRDRKLQYIEFYIEIWDEIIPDTEKELIKNALYESGINEYEKEFKYIILNAIEDETLDMEYVPNQLLEDKIFIKILKEKGYEI